MIDGANMQSASKGESGVCNIMHMVQELQK